MVSDRRALIRTNQKMTFCRWGLCALCFLPPTGWGKGHDDDMIQANSLRDEWSVDSWSAEDRYGTSCAQLDNFDWVMPASYPVSVLPRLEEDDSLSDID